MKRGRLQRDLSGFCSEVCEVLVSRGVTPSVRLVRAEWVAMGGSAPSFTDLLPLVRKWLAKRRNGRRVRALVRSYGRLDPVERGAAMLLMKQMKGSP